MAGSASEAKLAATASKTMLASPPEANLLALALVQKGILVTVANYFPEEMQQE